MAAGLYTFVIEQGTTVDFRLEYKDSSGQPIDLSDYHARMQMRPSISSNIVYMSLSSSLRPDGTGLNMTPRSGSKVLPKSSGSIGIYISAYSSSLLSFNEAHYDMELVSGSSYPYVIRLLEGKIRLKHEVTR